MLRYDDGREPYFRDIEYFFVLDQKYAQEKRFAMNLDPSTPPHPCKKPQNKTKTYPSNRAGSAVT